MALGFGALGFKEQGLRLWGSRFRVSGLWARDVRVWVFVILASSF